MRRILLLGAGALVLAAAIVVNLAILDIVSWGDLGESLGRIAAVVAVSVAALAALAALVAAAARRPPEKP